MSVNVSAFESWIYIFPLWQFPNTIHKKENTLFPASTSQKGSLDKYNKTFVSKCPQDLVIRYVINLFLLEFSGQFLEIDCFYTVILEMVKNHN